MLFHDQQPTVEGDREARGPIEIGGDGRECGGGGEAIDNAGAAIGKVERVIGGDGHAHEVVAAVHDHVEGRQGRHGLVGTRWRERENERRQRCGHRAGRQGQRATAHSRQPRPCEADVGEHEQQYFADVPDEVHGRPRPRRQTRYRDVEAREQTAATEKAGAAFPADEHCVCDQVAVLDGVRGGPDERHDERGRAHTVPQ